MGRGRPKKDYGNLYPDFNEEQTGRAARIEALTWEAFTRMRGAMTWVSKGDITYHLMVGAMGRNVRYLVRHREDIDPPSILEMFDDVYLAADWLRRAYSWAAITLSKAKSDLKTWVGKPKDDQDKYIRSLYAGELDEAYLENFSDRKLIEEGIIEKEVEVWHESIEDGIEAYKVGQEALMVTMKKKDESTITLSDLWAEVNIYVDGLLSETEAKVRDVGQDMVYTKCMYERFRLNGEFDEAERMARLYGELIELAFITRGQMFAEKRLRDLAANACLGRPIDYLEWDEYMKRIYKQGTILSRALPMPLLSFGDEGMTTYMGDPELANMIIRAWHEEDLADEVKTRKLIEEAGS